MDTVVLWMFMENIKDYEEGIYDIIKYYTKTYTFKDNMELNVATKLWCRNREECYNKYGHISEWNVSNITFMYELFSPNSSCHGLNSKFNDNINNWDVSNVTDMRLLFSGCKEFNQPLDKWDVSKVTDMEGMFADCQKFNQDISNWNVSNVNDMSNMFFNCQEFNQDISDWDISNIKDGLEVC